MPYLFLILSAMFLLGSCNKYDPATAADRIDGLLLELMEDHRSAGLSFALQIDDSLTMNGVYGFANYEEEEPIEQHSRFRIASITKPITATAILQLQEQGLLSLQDKISGYFPNFPKGDSITVYHLLSHTSGIPNWWEGGMPADEPADFPMCQNPHSYLERMQTPSLFEPGTHHYYSNSGYVLLGEIIEIVTGQTYEQFIRSNIFEPAKMNHTEMEYIERAIPQNWAKGYAWAPEEPHFIAPEVYHMPYSAGGLRSTSIDLLRFLTALLEGELLDTSTVRQMMSYAILDNGQVVHEQLFSPEGGAQHFPKYIRKWGYGLGFQIAENFGQKFVFHGGCIAGFNSVLIHTPHNNTKLVILSNTEDGILARLQKIEKTVASIEPHK